MTRIRCRPAVRVLALAGATLLAARAFAAVPLFVVGVGFAALAVLAPLWVLAAARGAVLHRELELVRTVEEEPFEAIIEIRRGWFGLPGAQLHDQLAGTSVSVAEPLSVLAGRRRVRLRVVVRLARRGRHRFAPPALTLSDPLALAQVTRSGFGHADELLVLPRTEPVAWARHAQQHASSGHASRSLREPLGAGEIDGLREYMPGTPASRIHWPALARGAGLLERRLVSEPQSLPLVVLDAGVGANAEPELLDAAVRATASLTLELGRAGGCSVLLPGERTPMPLAGDLAAWPAIHTRLALVEAGSRRGPALLLLRSVRAPVVYVAARAEAAQTALNATGTRASQLVLVLPHRLAASLELPSSFEVSGCSGVLLRSRTRNLRDGAAA